MDLNYFKAGMIRLLAGNIRWIAERGDEGIIDRMTCINRLATEIKRKDLLIDIKNIQKQIDSNNFECKDMKYENCYNDITLPIIDHCLWFESKYGIEIYNKYIDYIEDQSEFFEACSKGYKEYIKITFE